MPRLVGKRSNNDSAIAFLILILAVAVAVGAEYFGYVNVVPGFGRLERPMNQPARFEPF